MLSALYRRWASVRLADLEGWVRQWALPEMYAGVPGKGASQAWWETALRAELAQAVAEPWAVGCVDCYKCFDQIQSPLLYHALARAGFPVPVLSAYARFHEQLSVRNAVFGGLGKE